MKLDTLNRRLRFAPPQPDGRNIVLSERDWLIFEIINRHGPLPSTYLYELTRHLPKARDPVRFKARLTKLYNGYCTNWHTHTYTRQNGEHILNPRHACDIVSFLARPDWQQATGGANHQPLIYDLNPLSEVALAERNVPIVKRKDYPIHRFMSACVGASLKLYLESQLFTYADRSRLLAHAKCPPETRDLDNPLAVPVAGTVLIPDDFFAVQKEKASFYAVEIDRKTESIDSAIAKSSFGRKLKLYIEAMRTRAFSAHFGVPNTVKVLTVTTNTTHMRGMIAYYRTLHAPELADRFLFAAVSGFGRAWTVPPLLYFRWLDANGRQVPLG